MPQTKHAGASVIHTMALSYADDDDSDGGGGDGWDCPMKALRTALRVESLYTLATRRWMLIKKLYLRDFSFK